MSVLGIPAVAAVAARIMQGLMPFAAGSIRRRTTAVFPEYPGNTHEITIPTSIAPARAVVAPKYRFPVPPQQAFQAVQWIAEHGTEHGWDGSRLTIGGQSAGGGLAAAVARQALEQGGPAIAVQVLHYPPLDLTKPLGDKPSALAKPMLRPWMGEIFDNAYVPDRAMRADRLASPAGPADTANLTGIVPALVITPEFDPLHAEGLRYAQRLREAGALLEHIDVSQADHAYDMSDLGKAREIYERIADHLKNQTAKLT